MATTTVEYNGHTPSPENGTPRSALSRTSVDGMGPSRSPWAVQRNGGGSNRSSPPFGFSVNGSNMSLQSVNGNGSSAGRIMEQFELTFVNEPETRFVCPVCDKVMRYPLQFEECGHRCCSGCLNNLVRCVSMFVVRDNSSNISIRMRLREITQLQSSVGACGQMMMLLLAYSLLRRHVTHQSVE
jgi:hypothetical protein